MPKKEKKPIDLKSYVKQMEKSIGKKDKIKEVLDNDIAFKKYLISLGMNPEWTELPAVMEIIKNRFAKALREKSRRLRIKEEKIVLGKNNEANEILPNIINMNEFELGDEETLKYSTKSHTIEYIKTRGKANFEKREIDPSTGIVMRHLKRFGGNAVDEQNDDYYSAVEYIRDPREPKIIFKTYYKNASRDGEIDKSETFDYDYGYPTELEKNGTSHRKTPLYFIKRYPKYEQWFNRRFRSQDEYVQNVFEMQKDVMRDLWKRSRKSLQTTIINYARTRDKLDVYYKGLQEIFNTNIIGPVYKAFITTKIETIIDNDELHMFYEMGSGAEMKERILSRLKEEIEPKSLQEVVAEAGQKSKDRIEANPDYQTAKETFTGEIKSVYDDDYSIEDALVEISQHSSVVDGFSQESNPFNQEQSRIQEKIRFMEKQIKILKTAYKSFPRRKRSIKSAIEEIEEQKVKKPELPISPTQSDEEAR